MGLKVEIDGRTLTSIHTRDGWSGQLARTRRWHERLRWLRDHRGDDHLSWEDVDFILAVLQNCCILRERLVRDGGPLTTRSVASSMPTVSSASAATSRTARSISTSLTPASTLSSPSFESTSRPRSAGASPDAASSSWQARSTNRSKSTTCSHSRIAASSFGNASSRTAAPLSWRRNRDP